MKIRNGGFTLIELLVVVLIIGILAAVALPQYQKAVLKSRYSSLMPIAKSIANGNEAYYMEHGVYSNNLANLDIAGQGTYPDGGKITLHVANDFTYVMAENTNTPNNKYIVYQKHSEQFPDNIHCAALKGNTQAEWLCEKGFNGTPTTGSIEDGYKMYILQGNAEDGHYGTIYTNENNKHVSDGDKCVAKEYEKCQTTVATDGGMCVAQASGGCGSQSSFDNGSSCIAETGYACSGLDPDRPNTFTNNSTCEGKGNSSCRFGNFTGSTCQGVHQSSCEWGNFSNSTCEGEGSSSCVQGTFVNSTCTGHDRGACNNGTWENNSVCYAKAELTCQGTYKTGSYCAGGHCPAGTPAGDEDGSYANECWDGSGHHSADYCS